MKVLRALRLLCAQGFYRWAMREINPLHPDVPRIVQRQSELADAWRALWR